MSGPTLRILSVNDVYSLENLPRLKTLVRAETAAGHADACIVVLAGDFLAPSLLSSLDAGRGMVECLNDVGVTHVILGNHEDDVPIAELRARLQELSAVCIGTNVRGAGLALPASILIRVGKETTRSVTVGLIGVVMADPTVYRGQPFGGAELVDANRSALAAAAELTASGACTYVVPITHQPLADDRALASAWAGPPLRVIVGGHEHVVVVEAVNGATIVKAGSDAAAAAIIDLTWNETASARGAPDVPDCAVRIVSSANYEEDADLRRRVDRHLEKVHALEAAPLMSLYGQPALSSVGGRAQPTSLGALICSRLRDALGAEACVFNGGAIRANREYRGLFTYGDLKTEVPFDNEIVVARLPGSVIREAVLASRSPAPRETGGYLQVDDQLLVAEPEHRVMHIAGAPLDDAREYRVALVRNLLEGMDHIEPLARFGREHPEKVPATGSGRDVKTLLVDAFARALWGQLGGFEVVDGDHDGRVTRAELEGAVGRVAHGTTSTIAADLLLNALDTKHQGVVTRDEVPESENRGSA